MKRKVPTGLAVVLVLGAFAALAAVSWHLLDRNDKPSGDVGSIVSGINKQNPNLPPIDPGDDMKGAR